VAAVAMSLYENFYPNSLFVKAMHAGGGLIVIYQLDAYQRWIVHVRYILGGLKLEDLFWQVVGRASEDWLEKYFEEDDGFEDWEKFAE